MLKCKFNILIELVNVAAVLHLKKYNPENDAFYTFRLGLNIKFKLCTVLTA